MSVSHPKGSAGVQVISETKVKKPSLYKVIMLNDDFTTMEFVIEVLQNIFGKSYSEAYDTMMSIHIKGRGIAGIYTYDIAVSKVAQTEKEAEAHGFPLKCIIEKE